MNSILGFIDLLLTTELNPKQTEYAEIVRSSGSLLLLLIDDILDLSKIEARKLILETVPFSFGDIMREIIKLFEPRAIDKGIDLSLEIDPYFDDNEVSGDCHRIRQVMVNLIGNAVKFTRRGHVKIKAICRQKDDKTCFVEVTVEDTGIGISANDLPRIFDKFTQANTGTTRQFGGTGLGLAITRKLVDLMGGTLGCCSTPGKGSEFFFSIPLAVMSHQHNFDVKKLLQKASQPIVDIDPAKTLILIVEDDESSRKFVESCLEQRGFLYKSLCNGFEATEELNLHPYDLVILDWCLPGWSGLAIAEQIRKNAGPNQKVPIIAVTAKAMKGDRETCLAAGMDSYLAKPFPPEDLFRQILKLLTFKDRF
jgi:CheY-like chemotaxis protein